MLLAFPYVEKEEKLEVVKVIETTEKKREDNDDFRYKVNQLDNKQMLLELSGTRWLD